MVFRRFCSDMMWLSRFCGVESSGLIFRELFWAFDWVGGVVVGEDGGFVEFTLESANTFIGGWACVGLSSTVGVGGTLR